jgi:hypothetical protein
VRQCEAVLSSVKQCEADAGRPDAVRYCVWSAGRQILFLDSVVQTLCGLGAGCDACVGCGKTAQLQVLQPQMHVCLASKHHSKHAEHTGLPAPADDSRP